MSRSYKKNPVGKISSSYDKKLASRKVRRYKNVEDKIVDGCNYKRYYPQYDICDVWTRRTWEEDMASQIRLHFGGDRWWSWVGREKEVNEDGSLNWKYLYHEWYKYYRMK